MEESSMTNSFYTTTPSKYHAALPTQTQ